jgi:large subunit ribosomal protein L5
MKSDHKSVREIQKDVFEKMKSDFSYKNVMQSPKLQKVVISVGTGSAKDKKRAAEIIPSRLAKITGQKPSPRSAKKSIATFKLRQGDQIGYQVTLRGARMFAFLDKLLTIALPRTKDFRGISIKSVDDMGNYTFGIKEHTIFPECSDEELRDVFGMAVTLVTTSKTKKETEKFLTLIGFPFKKEESKK